MASLRSRLTRMFNTNVVVRAIGKDKLKLIDSNKLQSAGNQNFTRRIDRYGRAYRNTMGGYGTRHQTTPYQQAKVQLYTDYEAMDSDSLIASALDIYADETTLKDTENEILTIRTENENIEAILNNLFYDILNIEFNLWHWTRSMCKYGDFYLKLNLQDGVGVVNAFPMSSYEVERIEEFDEQNEAQVYVKFVYEGMGQQHPLEQWEVAHFRILGDSNFLPYGRSILETVRKQFQQLMLMEDALLVQRIMRAPDKRIYRIDVGNIPPEEIDNFMNDIIDGMKKVPHIDPQTGEYNLKFNIANMIEDVFLPVRGDRTGTQVDTLPGLQWDGTADLEYIRQKIMAGLKVPKAFLNYEEGVEGKATLAAMDIRFARTIERIQRFVEGELKKIAVVHLVAQGFEGADLASFDLQLTPPSIVYDQQRVALMNEKMDVATKMVESKLFSHKYVYENIFNMSEGEWIDIRNNVIEDLKLAFREEQIAQEGNDPAISGESFGTPHDLASLHMSSNKEKDPGGRPKEGLKFGQHKHPLGWDPVGAKEQKHALRPDSDPLGISNRYENIKRRNSAVKQLFEQSNPLSGSFLDETRLLD